MSKIKNIIFSPLTAALLVYRNTGEIDDKYRKQYEEQHGPLPPPEEFDIIEQIKKKYKSKQQ
jgi:hypothetical protein